MDEEVTCKMCGASFASADELDAHNREEHGMGAEDDDEENA